MTGSKLAHRSPSRRIVLLGASNLTRGVGRAVVVARAIWNEPVEILLAHGHGRSYGLPSSVLGRTLPGIERCGLWPALGGSPAAPTHALLTDIGNDIFYGAEVETIAAWIGTCLDRLARAEAEVVVARLPLASARTLSPRWFETVRSIFFPTRRISLAEALSKAADLDGRLVELAAAHGFKTMAPPAEWYGLDPIHIRRRDISNAWRAYFSQWSAATGTAQGSFSPGLWLRIRTRTPDDVHLLGKRFRGRQPCARLRDGTTIAMY